ncbi:MAG: glycosyltransferase [Oligoflexia bacterium]|nr:glycosyltransferase [Oligoflexia bacterium]
MKNLWIVTPVYYDVESFLLLYQEIETSLNSNLFPYQKNFLVIDDSAHRDRSIQKLKKISNIKVLHAPQNLGHQHALVLGLRHLKQYVADHDLVITLDSDGQDDPKDCPQMLQTITSAANAEASVVVAQRTKRSESFCFKVFYLCFKIMFKLLTGTSIKSGNFVAYKGAFLKRYIDHYFFNLCYSSSFYVLGVTIASVPCERRKRMLGESKMNLFSLIKHGLRMLLPFIKIILLRIFIFLLLLSLIALTHTYYKSHSQKVPGGKVAVLPDRSNQREPSCVNSVLIDKGLALKVNVVRIA